MLGENTMEWQHVVGGFALMLVLTTNNREDSMVCNNLCTLLDMRIVWHPSLKAFSSEL